MHLQQTISQLHLSLTADQLSDCKFVVRKVVCSIIGSRPDGLGSSKARYHVENFSFMLLAMVMTMEN